MARDPLPGWEHCVECGGGGWRISPDREVPCRTCDNTGLVVSVPRDGLRFVPVIRSAQRAGTPYAALVSELAVRANALIPVHRRGGSPKLTEQQAREIRIRRATGDRVAALAREYRVSEPLIYSILNGKASAYS